MIQRHPWPCWLKTYMQTALAFAQTAPTRSSKKVGGFARHSLESLPAPPGPARLQNAPPKIRPACVQVPSSKGYGARRYTPTPAPPESKGRKINEESAPGHRPDWCWCMSSGSPGEQLKTKAYTGGGGARGGPSSGTTPSSKILQRDIVKNLTGPLPNLAAPQDPNRGLAKRRLRSICSGLLEVPGASGQGPRVDISLGFPSQDGPSGGPAMAGGAAEGPSYLRQTGEIWIPWTPAGPPGTYRCSVFSLGLTPGMAPKGRGGCLTPRLAPRKVGPPST